MTTRMLRTRKFRKGRTVALLAALSFAALSLPARGDDGGAHQAVAAQALTAPVTVAALSPGASDAAEPGIALSPKSAAPAETPSLAEVLELLHAQGQEIATLRAALHDQQELTARLAARLNATEPTALVAEAALPAAAAVTYVGAAQPDLPQRVAQLETSVGQNQKNVAERLKQLGPFVFSGDLRLRAEPTFGGPTDDSQDRFRERIRFRFNAEAKLNDQLRGGFSLASGDLNNPTSTNQTLNQYDTRKPIAIDRAYAAYTPDWLKPLTLT